MNNDPKPGQLDPEIAELMGFPEEKKETPPDFGALFGPEEGAEAEQPEPISVARKTFQKIEKILDNPKPFFKDKNYYKIALNGEKEAAKRLHTLLNQFINSSDPNDKSMYRARLVPAFWEVASSIATRCSGELPVPKQLLLRFGILSPSLLGSELQDLFSRIVYENTSGEPIYYMDEWMQKVSRGQINPSATDEVKQVKRDENQKNQEKIEKRRGQRQAEYAILQNKLQQLESTEANLQNQVQMILRHETRPDFGGLKDAYTVAQREAMSEITSLLRALASADKDIRDCYSHLEEMDREIKELTDRMEGSGGAAIDRSTVINEFNSVRQMAKMCVGRQGNHFPILLKQYLRPNIADVATRENVLNTMMEVENLDEGVFLRSYKTQINRIVPYVLLLPSYGETGVCWEPFERFNRASSRGRVALPMYPKNLRIAIVAAMADLRWQVAKEKAQHYWMEEGITGRYYQWFSDHKLKGDVKEYFIRDYILWITKESQATQKLDREVRGIFWRMMPFPQSIKDELRNRGFVYNELYKKDVNISRSDGY